MYQIIVNGEVVCTTRFVCWNKWVQKVKSYVYCTEDEAEVVLVHEDTEEGEEPKVPYYANIYGKPVKDPTIATATVEKVSDDT